MKKKRVHPPQFSIPRIEIVMDLVQKPTTAAGALLLEMAAAHGLQVQCIRGEAAEHAGQPA